MPSRSRHIVGELIDGRYRVEGLLARGGMGAVYRAHQMSLGRKVALKILEPEQDSVLSMSEFRERFLLEASTAARISHPNAVSIYDYGDWQGILFISMELIEGTTLVRNIRQSAPMPEYRVVHIAKQICGPLHEAHQLGIAHRDLKPGNIMLLDTSTTTDFVKVLDFGLAKRVRDPRGLTQPGMFLGSPNYVAPEQITGRPLDGRADIYALGAIMWEMLTNRPPFARGSQAETIMAHLNEPPPPLSARVSPKMQTIVKTCLAKNPQERFTNIPDLLRALHRIKPSPTTARSLIRPTTRLLARPAMAPRRRYRARVDPWDAFLLLVGVLSLLAAGVWAFILN